MVRVQTGSPGCHVLIRPTTKKCLKLGFKALFVFFRGTTYHHVTENVTQNVTQIVTQMTAITFSFVLHTHVLADKTRKILLRITQHRTHKYIDIGYSVKAEDWNKEKKEVRRSHPLWAEIKMVMDAKLIEAKQTYLKNLSQDIPISSTNIKRQLKKEIIGDSFLNFADAYIQNMPNASSQTARESIINKLKEYLGKSKNGVQKDLLFPELDYKFLVNYEKHLKRLGNGKNTIHGNIKFLKTVYNFALKTRHFRTSDNPFLEYSAPQEKSSRTRLKPFQIEDIENYQAKPNTPKFHARNIFLFSYYLQGMRVKDLLLLRWKQIKGDYLHYKSSKANKERPRKLHRRAREILNLYRSERAKPNDYVFPYMAGIDEKQLEPKKWVKKIDGQNSKIRKQLMLIAEELGIEKLSMHVARHTFANIARQITKDIFVVSDALDHSSISITENYFGSAAPEENDDLVKQVFGE